MPPTISPRRPVTHRPRSLDPGSGRPIPWRCLCSTNINSKNSKPRAAGKDLLLLRQWLGLNIADCCYLLGMPLIRWHYYQSGRRA